MFFKLFKCFWRRPAKVLVSDQYARNGVSVDSDCASYRQQGEKTSFLQNVFKRHTKEQEILLCEKSHLKKYLRFNKLYIDGMTIGEMRVAKRFLEASHKPDVLFEGDYNNKLSCCCCFKSNLKTVPNFGKRVTVKQNMVQYRSESDLFLPSKDSTVIIGQSMPLFVAIRNLKTIELSAITETHKDEHQAFPRGAHGHYCSLELEFDLGPFPSNNCNDSTYIAFEQPEP